MGERILAAMKTHKQASQKNKYIAGSEEPLANV